MLEKINISNVIKDHIATLKNYNEEKYNKFDIFLFFAIPIIPSGTLLYFDIKLKAETINIILTSFSIFAALLFNLLVLIYGITQRNEFYAEINRLKMMFIKQIYDNISFCIAISIFVITLLFVLSLTYDVKIQFYKPTIEFLVYYLASNFILTIFMVLKRIHILLSKEFDNRVTK